MVKKMSNLENLESSKRKFLEFHNLSEERRSWSRPVPSELLPIKSTRPRRPSHGLPLQFSNRTLRVHSASLHLRCRKPLVNHDGLSRGGWNGVGALVFLRDALFCHELRRVKRAVLEDLLIRIQKRKDLTAFFAILSRSAAFEICETGNSEASANRRGAIVWQSQFWSPETHVRHRARCCATH